MLARMKWIDRHCPCIIGRHCGYFLLHFYRHGVCCYIRTAIRTCYRRNCHYFIIDPKDQNIKISTTTFWIGCQHFLRYWYSRGGWVNKRMMNTFCIGPNNGRDCTFSLFSITKINSWYISHRKINGTILDFSICIWGQKQGWNFLLRLCTVPDAFYK